jgi:hypothetical protein
MRLCTEGLKDDIIKEIEVMESITFLRSYL